MSCPCSNALEDPWQEPDESMFSRSVSPEQAPDSPTYLNIDFQQGDPVAIDGHALSPATLLTTLNTVGFVWPSARRVLAGLQILCVCETPTSSRQPQKHLQQQTVSVLFSSSGSGSWDCRRLGLGHAGVSSHDPTAPQDSSSCAAPGLTAACCLPAQNSSAC